MAMNPARIPLFPLDIVLFPGQAVPLHIFEPRYRQMTRNCMDTQTPFGVVYASGVTLAQTGCSATIVKILKEYEDGRSDILTAGQTAFRLLETLEGKAYLEADVEYLEEDFVGVESAVPARLEQLCNQCHQLLYGEDASRFETEGGISLAYHVASELPVEAAIRQSLLEIRSEAARQSRLVSHLAEWYPQLQKRERVRGKASGNGHSKL
jgi:ATP-dependent Lon protease